MKLFKQFKQQRGWSLVLPAVCPAIVVPYRFRMWRRDFAHLVFLVTAVIIPLFLTAVQAFVSLSAMTKNYIVWSVMVIGVLYFVVKGRWRALVHTGAIGFYLYEFKNIPLILFFSLVGTISHQSVSVTCFIAGNLVASVLVTALVMVLAPDLRAKVRLTFSHPDGRRQFLYLPLLMVTGGLVITGCDWLQQVINPGKTSANEGALNAILNNGHIVDLMLAVVLIVVVGPITEELVARHALVQLTGTPALGFVTSVVWFSALHISQQADWINIVGYLGGALMLTVVFFVFNYNFVFSSVAHMVLNLIATVTILSVTS